ncbi:MAG: carbohydrate kinase family protein, partial [Actinomycetes bacterium]
MRICVTGSIATDHLMSFEGRFSDALVASQLDNLSVSFLVGDLNIRRGGVAANIAFSLGCLGLTPVLVGAVGASDFDDYRAWLDRHGVDTESVHVSSLLHSARFTCTTDQDSNQIASFYPGAMADARNIELAPVAARLGGIDLLVVSPNDPEAMLRHTAEARYSGITFVADPSQQMGFMGGDQIIALIEGAQYLFTNEYESALIEKKTGWSARDVAERVRTRVTTFSDKGASIECRGSAAISVPAVPVDKVVDPTGVGDAFRAGYLAGLSWDLEPVRCAQIGATLAAFVIETTGTQEYT